MKNEIIAIFINFDYVLGKQRHKIPLNPMIFGAITCHGIETQDGSFVVIPPNIELCPLVASGTSLTGHQLLSDIELYKTSDGRQILTPDCCQIYKPGYVLRNITLHFKTTFPDSNRCYTTGIMTGRIHETLMELEKFKTDIELRTELMCYHTDAIIPKKELWDTRRDLGDVIKLITNAGKFGRYIGIFCRTTNPKMECNLPKFLTIKMTDEIYNSNFFTKLELLETCATNKEFPEFSLIGLRPSKLKMRVTFTELCSVIRKKLSINNTISTFEFHSVIEIYHAKKIPMECVLFAVDIKFKFLIKQLDTISEDNINFDINFELNITDKKAFKTGLQTLCVKFRENIVPCIIKYQREAFDKIIFIAEEVVNGQLINKSCYDKITEYDTAFKKVQC